MNWHEADDFCKTLDMELLTFDTKQEFSNIMENIEHVTNFRGFIGAKRRGRLNDWIWAETGKTIESSVLQFAAGEPNNNNNNENCLETLPQSKTLNDCSCDEKSGFVCQEIY